MRRGGVGSMSTILEDSGEGRAPEVLRAAQRRVGLSLPEGWRVVAAVEVPKGEGESAGSFGRGYVVEAADGRRGFLKALDYSSAFKQPEPSRALEAMTRAYNFERDLLARC